MPKLKWNVNQSRTAAAAYAGLIGITLEQHGLRPHIWIARLHLHNDSTLQLFGRVYTGVRDVVDVMHQAEAWATERLNELAGELRGGDDSGQ